MFQIVALLIEDNVVINSRKKRLEKSKIQNALHKRYVNREKEEEGKAGSNKTTQLSHINNRKGKRNNNTDTATPAKKTKFDKKKQKSEK